MCHFSELLRLFDPVDSSIITEPKSLRDSSHIQTQYLGSV